MIGFLKGLVLLPVAIVVVLLAVANRGPVTLSFDPFSSGAPEISLTLPLFAILFAAVALGVVVGGVGAWLSQSGNRRARRQAAREVKRLRVDAERHRVDSERNRAESERRRDYPTGRDLVASPGATSR